MGKARNKSVSSRHKPTGGVSKAILSKPASTFIQQTRNLLSLSNSPKENEREVSLSILSGMLSSPSKCKDILQVSQDGVTFTKVILRRITDASRSVVSCAIGVLRNVALSGGDFGMDELFNRGVLMAVLGAFSKAAALVLDPETPKEILESEFDIVTQSVKFFSILCTQRPRAVDTITSSETHNYFHVLVLLLQPLDHYQRILGHKNSPPPFHLPCAQLLAILTENNPRLSEQYITGVLDQNRESIESVWKLMGSLLSSQSLSFSIKLLLLATEINLYSSIPLMPLENLQYRVFCECPSQASMLMEMLEISSVSWCETHQGELTKLPPPISVNDDMMNDGEAEVEGDEQTQKGKDVFLPPVDSSPSPESGPKSCLAIEFEDILVSQVAASEILANLFSFDEDEEDDWEDVGYQRIPGPGLEKTVALTPEQKDSLASALRIAFSRILPSLRDIAFPSLHDSVFLGVLGSAESISSSLSTVTTTTTTTNAPPVLEVSSVITSLVPDLRSRCLSAMKNISSQNSSGSVVQEEEEVFWGPFITSVWNNLASSLSDLRVKMEKNREVGMNSEKNEDDEQDPSTQRFLSLYSSDWVSLSLHCMSELISVSSDLNWPPREEMRSIVELVSSLVGLSRSADNRRRNLVSAITLCQGTFLPRLLKLNQKSKIDDGLIIELMNILFGILSSPESDFLVICEAADVVFCVLGDDSASASIAYSQFNIQSGLNAAISRLKNTLKVHGRNLDVGQRSQIDDAILNGRSFVEYMKRNGR